MFLSVVKIQLFLIISWNSQFWLLSITVFSECDINVQRQNINSYCLLFVHTYRVNCLVVLPNNQLASGSFDNTIRIWDVNKGKGINILKGYTGNVYCLVVLPNNQLASCSGDTTIRIWI